MCSNFINSCLKDTTYTSSTQVSRIRKYRQFMPNLYDISLHLISWNTLKQLYQLCNLPPQMFTVFITFMIEGAYIINFFESEIILKWLKTPLNEDSIKAVFTSEFANRWYLYSANNDDIAPVYINSNRYMRDILDEFISISPLVRARNTKVTQFYRDFDKSLAKSGVILPIKTIEDFNYDTFQAQFNFYSLNNSNKLLNILVTFYIFLYTQNPNIFKPTDGIDYYILLKNTCIHDYTKGARKILYNPYDPIPSLDIWLLDPNTYNHTSNQITNETRKLIDFTLITNPLYRTWSKDWFWSDISPLTIKLQRFHYIKPFINYLTDLKQGIQKSFYIKKTDQLNFDTISLNEIMAYKFHLEDTVTNTISLNSHILSVKNFLTFLKDKNLVQVESACFYYLKSKPNKPTNSAKSIPNHELESLVKYMKSISESAYTNRLNLAIFYLGLETEFRLSQILNLSTDCVHQTTKPNEYMLISKTKTSKGKQMEQPITTYNKAEIEEIIRFTSEVRASCTDLKIKNYLFISKSNRKNIFTQHKEKEFNTFLKSCCEHLNLQPYVFANLRDSRITKAQAYVLHHNLGESAQLILTNHSNINTDRRHYIESNIEEMLELTYSTIIGDVTLTGSIEYTCPEVESSENLVSSQCGYCKTKTCTQYSYLDCLLCSSFVATVDRIPFFDEAIKTIDIKIQNASLVHDKEDLSNIKLLLINYLKQLYIKKEENNVELS